MCPIQAPVTLRQPPLLNLPAARQAIQQLDKQPALTENKDAGMLTANIHVFVGVLGRS